MQYPRISLDKQIRQVSKRDSYPNRLARRQSEIKRMLTSLPYWWKVRATRHYMYNPKGGESDA